MARDWGSKNKAPSEKVVKKNISSALDRMIGVPIQVEEDLPTSAAERVALLLNRIQELKAQSGPNKYQSSFENFLFELCLTKDEAAGGRVAHLPQDPYIYEQIDAYFRCPLLLLEKSRRVRASWITCAFDLWVCAGGQDKRWEALMHSTENRQVVIASRKLQDAQGSSWFLNNRVKFIYDELEKSGVREHWPSFPTAEWTATEARFSNGSRMNAVAQGADQLRGVSASLVHIEEGAFWSEAKASIEAALPTIHGGGHILIVTTPNAGSYCSDLVKGRLRDRGSLYG